MAPKKAPKTVAKKGAKPAPQAQAKAAPKVAAALPHQAATCPCPCHEPIDTKKYGCWCNCHVFALLMQKGTLLAWLVATVTIFVFNLVWHGWVLVEQYMAAASFFLPEEAMRPELFMLGDVLTGLVVALLFRLAFTGCGGLVEGIKLGVLLLAPIAVVSVTSTLGSQPIPAQLVYMWGLGYLLQGALVGGLLAWLLGKNSSCCCR